MWSCLRLPGYRCVSCGRERCIYRYYIQFIRTLVFWIGTTDHEIGNKGRAQALTRHITREKNPDSKFIVSTVTACAELLVGQVVKADPRGIVYVQDQTPLPGIRSSQ